MIGFRQLDVVGFVPSVIRLDTAITRTWGLSHE